MWLTGHLGPQTNYTESLHRVTCRKREATKCFKDTGLRFCMFVYIIYGHDLEYKILSSVFNNGHIHFLCKVLAAFLFWDA